MRIIILFGSFMRDTLTLHSGLLVTTTTTGNVYETVSERLLRRGSTMVTDRMIFVAGVAEKNHNGGMNGFVET